MLLGAPAQPMTKSTSDAIARLAVDTDGVSEAHLPQCFVVGVMEKPAQILVVVTVPGTNPDSILREIGDGLRTILPDGEFLDVWPVQSGNSMLNDVRGAGCEIYKSVAGPNDTADRKPWWKFW
jgi:hypothetical protein